jgi:hypothetical protein
LVKKLGFNPWIQEADGKRYLMLIRGVGLEINEFLEQAHDQLAHHQIEPDIAVRMPHSTALIPLPQVA